MALGLANGYVQSAGTEAQVWGLRPAEKKRESAIYHPLWDSQWLMGLCWSKSTEGGWLRAKEPDAQIWDGGWSEGSVGLDHLLRPGSQFLYLANRVDFKFARGGLAMVRGLHAASPSIGLLL